MLAHFFSRSTRCVYIRGAYKLFLACASPLTVSYIVKCEEPVLPSVARVRAQVQTPAWHRHTHPHTHTHTCTRQLAVSPPPATSQSANVSARVCARVCVCVCAASYVVYDASACGIAPTSLCSTPRLLCASAYEGHAVMAAVRSVRAS